MSCDILVSYLCMHSTCVTLDSLFFFFLMIRRPPRSTRTDTLFPTRRSSDLIDELPVSPSSLTAFGHLHRRIIAQSLRRCLTRAPDVSPVVRSEEHTSELQSLMRISYAVFCLKKKNKTKNIYAQATKELVQSKQNSCRINNRKRVDNNI